MLMKNLRFVILFLIVAAFSFPADDIKFTYSFKAGDTYDYVSTSKQTILQSIPGMGDVTTEASTEGAMKFKVAELTPSGAKIESRYVRLKINTKSSIVNMNMDSEGPADDTQNKILKSMMNKPFFFVLSKTGQVEKVEGVDNMFSGLESLGLDQATVEAAKKSMQQSINENMLKASLESAFVNYPDKKVKPSDTWTTASTMNVNFSLATNSTWTFKKVEGNVASIDCDGTVTTSDKEKIANLPNGLKSKSDLTGRQVMAAKVDVKSGWPTEIKTLSEIKGKMILLAGGMLPTDMEVPMEIQSEGTTTIKKN